MTTLSYNDCNDLYLFILTNNMQSTTCSRCRNLLPVKIAKAGNFPGHPYYHVSACMKCIQYTVLSHYYSAYVGHIVSGLGWVRVTFWAPNPTWAGNPDPTYLGRVCQSGRVHAGFKLGQQALHTFQKPKLPE